MMIQSVTKAGKKLFVILILGITLLQSGCNKATKETLKSVCPAIRQSDT